MEPKLKNTLRPREVVQLTGRTLMAVYTAIWNGRLKANKDSDGWHIDADSARSWVKGKAEN